jgi:hypothetical protein
MKSQIVPILMFCIAFPWIAARVFQTEGRHENKMEKPTEWFRHESVRENDKPAILPISFGELSNKQINYLIP